MAYTIGELFDKIEQLSTEEDRAAFLKKHQSDIGFLTAIQLACDKRVVFDLPEGAPPVEGEVQPDGLSDSNLRMEIRRMYIFIKDHPSSKSLPKYKRENIFLQMLQSFGKLDRKALINIKDKTVPWLTKSLLEASKIQLLKDAINNFMDSPKSQTESKKSTTKTSRTRKSKTQEVQPEQD